MGDWQPIETAPKDGTRLMLWTTTRIDPDDIQYIETICDRDHLDMIQLGFWNEYAFGGAPAWEVRLIGKPTHWMPLPPPPSHTQKGENP